jgi:hypothetical protein
MNARWRINKLWRQLTERWRIYEVIRDDLVVQCRTVPGFFEGRGQINLRALWP